MTTLAGGGATPAFVVDISLCTVSLYRQGVVLTPYSQAWNHSSERRSSTLKAKPWKRQDKWRSAEPWTPRYQHRTRNCRSHRAYVVRAVMTEGVQIVWTPWRNRAELLQNRTWLFPASAVHDESGPLEMRRKACDQVGTSIIRLLPMGPFITYG